MLQNHVRAVQTARSRLLTGLVASLVHQIKQAEVACVLNASQAGLQPQIVPHALCALRVLQVNSVYAVHVQLGKNLPILATDAILVRLITSVMASYVRYVALEVSQMPISQPVCPVQLHTLVLMASAFSVMTGKHRTPMAPSASRARLEQQA